MNVGLVHRVATFTLCLSALCFAEKNPQTRILSAVPLAGREIRAQQNPLTLSEDGRPCELKILARPVSDAQRSAIFSSAGLVAVLFDGTSFLPSSGGHSISQATEADCFNFLKKLPIEWPVAVYAAAPEKFAIIRDFVGASGRGQLPAIRQASPETVKRAVGFFQPPRINPHTTVQVHVVSEEISQLNTVQSIANHLGGLPGRKALVWVCDNISFENPLPAVADRAYYPFLAEMAALRKANMSLYTINCGAGLRSGLKPTLSSSGLPAPEALSPRGTMSESHSPSAASTRMLAEITGGRTFSGSKLIKQALEQALQDNRCAFQLEWIPPPESATPLHRLVLSSGTNSNFLYPHYFYTPIFPLDLPARLTAIEAAFETPLDARAIAIDVTYDSTTRRSEVRFDPRRVNFVENSSRRDALLDVVYAFFDGNDVRLKEGFKSEIRTQMTPTKWQSFRDRWQTVTRVLNVPAAAKTLRVAVRDAHGGSIGSAALYGPGGALTIATTTRILTTTKGSM